MQLRNARNLLVSMVAAMVLALWGSPGWVHGESDSESPPGQQCYFAGSEYEPNQTVCIDGYEHRCNGQTGVLVRGSKVCSSS